MFLESSLDAIAWDGATCPDGVVVTADEGCLGHLDVERRVEASEAARWLGLATLGCWIDPRYESECTDQLGLGTTELVAQGDDLRFVWGPRFARHELLLERATGTSWANASHGLRVVAAPMASSEPSARRGTVEVDVFVIRVDGEHVLHWRSEIVTRADQWRTRIRGIHGLR